MINEWENIVHWEETEQSEALANNFYSHLSLKTVFPALKMTLNCYINIWTFLFLENWQFVNKLSLPISFTNILSLKDYPHNLTKYEIKGTSKIPISQFFRKIWEKNWQNVESAAETYIQNTQFSYFFLNWKNEKSR